MGEPVETLEGWWVLHDFRRVDWQAWRRWPETDRAAAMDELVRLVQGWEQLQAAHEGDFALYRVAGNREDLLFLHFRPAFDELEAAKTALNKTRLGDILRPGYSYVSVVELSGYLAGGKPADPRSPELRARLEPPVPAARHVCFYPMTKRRQGADNWYMLPRSQRAVLMRSHGAIGHKYAEQVVQLISGSQGLDEWEWGVTLFADDPLAFKKIVYEMRFDEASARYADFGPFLVGTRLPGAELRAYLALR
ncbi:MAG: heme-dependent peroxidase [Firmicutes bacterium]|nr:heme-dependent peroxidase [Bacillota bacterium]